MSSDLAPTSTQWAQLREESPEEFAAFGQWLALAPRPAPSQCGPGIGELAGRLDWLGRAQAYDAACELMRAVPDLNPNGLIRNAVESWAMLTAIESNKLVKSAMANRTSTVDSTALLSFMHKFLELGQAYASQSEEYDATDLTPAEQADLIRLHAKLKRK